MVAIDENEGPVIAQLQGKLSCLLPHLIDGTVYICEQIAPRGVAQNSQRRFVATAIHRHYPPSAFSIEEIVLVCFRLDNDSIAQSPQ